MALATKAAPACRSGLRYQIHDKESFSLIRIQNFRVPITDDTPLTELAARRLKQPPQSILEVAIVRRALDARRKGNISFVYTLQVKTKLAEGAVLARLPGDRDIAVETETVPEDITTGTLPMACQPVIVGMGPAGLLAAYMLARHGYRPLVLERGRDVERRTQDIARFWATGHLDETSNVQFGEGGAGTFSDGKLTTRVNDPKISAILDILIEAGAPEEIRYIHKPHVGTDKLRSVVKKLRDRIIAMGGQVEFESRVTDIKLDAVTRKITGLIINEERHISADIVLLGIGHSARDTYEMLHRRGVMMEAKAFAIGVRIEHPQEMMDKAQFGPSAGHPKLGKADYALVHQDKASGRAAYSFCMCPGGLVVASASESGGVVTNGMSNYLRNSGVANSALVVNVTPADFGGHVLDGIAFQRHYEKLAFAAGGGNYHAPVQTVGDFLTGRKGSGKFLAGPSYKPGITAADLRQCLPGYVADTLSVALPEFGRKIHGFDHPGVVMTGVETRTSAPLRLVRDGEYVSLETPGLYPIGEGAGYAGGIMSAALDGMNAALAVIRKYKQP